MDEMTRFRVRQCSATDLFRRRLVVEEGNDAPRITKHQYIKPLGTVAFYEQHVTRITRQIGMDVHIGNFISTIDGKSHGTEIYIADDCITLKAPISRDKNLTTCVYINNNLFTKKKFILLIILIIFAIRN